MEQLPQLIMRHPNLENLPPFALPYGWSLQNHIEGMEKEWEILIQRAFGNPYAFDEVIRNGGGYEPEYVLYLSSQGKKIATTTAIEKVECFPNEGWLRMVGVDPEFRGHGAGKLIVLAALHLLANRGYKTCVLSTDDERIPAIRLYYHMGFRPVYTHESHEKRWEKILPLVI